MQVSTLVQRGLAIGALGISGLSTTACMIAPVDGREISSRSTPIAVTVLLPPEWEQPLDSISFLDDQGNSMGGFCCGPLTTTPFMTDDTGRAWLRADESVHPFTESWFLNRDTSHPRAKWKLRMRMTVERLISKTPNLAWGDGHALFTFAGNPDGSFTSATTNCLQANRSGGGAKMAAACSQGFIADVYAIND